MFCDFFVESVIATQYLVEHKSQNTLRYLVCGVCDYHKYCDYLNGRKNN